MAARIPESVAKKLIARIEASLTSGGKPPETYGPGKSAIEIVAEEMIANGEIQDSRAVRHKLEAAEKFHGLKPDWDLWRPARYQQSPARYAGAIIRPVPPADFTHDEEERVLVIPDLHQCPRNLHRLEVMKWISRHGSQHKFPRVVQLGDWLSMDSCSRHEKNDTYRGRTKPLISDDMDVLKASLGAWEDGRDKGWKPKLWVTLGNHEQRLCDYENANPETWGVMTDQMQQLWGKAGWRTSPFGEILYINGVAFSHAPIGMMGKPISGKTAGPRTANELTTDLVHGHTHRFSTTRVPKIGPRDSVMVVEAGCALPWGEVEDYAKHSMTGWWWGVVELTLRGSEITDWNAVSMKTLRALYSDDGADVRRAA